MRMRIGLIACTLGALLIAGCVEQIPVTYYPPFYNPSSFDAIGIRSFTGATAVSQQVGNVLAGQFAIDMVANGTYSRVYNLGQDRQVEALDGIIIVTVEHFSADRLIETRLRSSRPVSASGRSGGRRVDDEQLMVNDVRLTVSARIETPRGQILYATPEPITAHIRSEEATAGALMSLDECYYRAIRQVSAELVRQFAVTEMVVSVDPSKALFTATKRDEHGDWIRTDTFAMSDPMMRVVLTLPAEADGNIFHLVLVDPRNPDKILDQEPVLWGRNRSETGRAFVFVPMDLMVKAGTGKLQVQLRSGDAPLVTHDFQIVERLPEVPEDTESVEASPVD